MARMTGMFPFSNDWSFINSLAASKEMKEEEEEVVIEVDMIEETASTQMGDETPTDETEMGKDGDEASHTGVDQEKKNPDLSEQGILL